MRQYGSWFLNSAADMGDLGRHRHCDERLFGPLVLCPEAEWEGEGEGGSEVERFFENVFLFMIFRFFAPFLYGSSCCLIDVSGLL
ncbi:unnamed protein product [Penicillium roqueforti FM164]|uniref:Genomic scaffold, ProqFM164S02 n=1 Tax=Penicillium roqueforti (strain FM164) TaxID=1365484 RepID=W6Q0Y8_PENRF|nr:unnamed protein product [Penicillium roqueforti FM164]